ncbi:xanthine dehydrogenase accessory protein XdhC [Meiothermus taiwanensis]|jgi:xanthine dehydrogenase accessory factor|uniref:Xanthine dehydrogenase accessory protein XdhC n=2 Tax=Meiothermus taiwanensis TaxID=172827 RepID=A0A399DTK9_9DEIN|nr:xanthine dehydrogenase accessory protein XdhC [Meiothermus taiwanensis]AWR86757.1 xanthine dehydrogenase accessory protein XdhC [Meiothermus taiwanensis WR-220]KIQ55311.1 molybdenum cofactor sulfurylase [Meiothermus taiwanensis]KZK14935.1 xanthine dehydrogenase accessory protein XdhC [Meiothermus taiwanensis]RIH75584.1 xanthine dehydrogenase accessory protein XdhC [Meiothermus taiwanensis]
MRWFEHLAQLTERRIPLVLVTLVAVRGHAPREAGAKMLVTAEAVYGTIGGGNLEATAVGLARRMLSETGQPTPQMHTLRLTEQAPAEYGVQCCGGEVTLLLERVVPARPTVAIFGVGHVGLALAQVLSICPVALWLVDSRAEMLSEARLAPLRHGEAEIKAFHAPILDGVVNDLPAGSHLVVMTHDHAEDLFVLEMALRRADLGYIGLIGSAGKWARFRQKLMAQGFSEQDLQRVTTPIGLPGIQSKAPEAIAIATAAQLLPFIFQDSPQALPGRAKVVE